MSNVYSLANAGHVRQGCFRIIARYCLCEDLAQQVMNRGMHALRCGAKPDEAIRVARDYAGALARMSAAFSPTEPAA